MLIFIHNEDPVIFSLWEIGGKQTWTAQALCRQQQFKLLCWHGLRKEEALHEITGQHL